MEQTEVKITWPQFIDAFRTYAVRFATPPSKKIIADIERVLQWFYPSIVNNAWLIQSINYNEVRRKIMDMQEEEKSIQEFTLLRHHRTWYYRMQAFVAFQKINRQIDENSSDIHSTFFTVTHVMECFKRHMQKSGWGNLLDRPLNGEVKRLTGQAENNAAETFYAEGIGTAWITATVCVPRGDECDWVESVRVDNETIKRRLQKILFSLLDAKIANKHTHLIIVFANDTATSEIIAPYFPHIKSLGIRIFGVKSAEEITEF
jgi:hypothetical protein